MGFKKLLIFINVKRTLRWSYFNCRVCSRSIIIL